MSEPGRASMSSHILPTAGTMIGICTTLIGLVKLHKQQDGPKVIDEHAALVALLFLVSALCSYLSMRFTPKPRISAGLERIADTCFVVGLSALALVSVVFAYEIL